MKDQIERIKLEFLKGSGYEKFYTFARREGITEFEITILMQRAFNAALELAAEKARCRTNDESTSIIVDKESILSLKLKG